MKTRDLVKVIEKEMEEIKKAQTIAEKQKISLEKQAESYAKYIMSYVAFREERAALYGSLTYVN